jgi:hypothetical protein
MKKKQLIHHIRSLTFTCVDNTNKTEEEEAEELNLKRMIEEDALDFMRCWRKPFDRYSKYIKTKAGKEALEDYYNDYNSYDKFHLAVHYVIAGRIISDVVEGYVTKSTINAFNHNTDCMENAPNIKDIRKALEELVVPYKKRENARKIVW